MPSSLGHLRTFSERTHMSMKGFLRRMSKKTGNANVWSIAGAPKRGAMRALIKHVCGYLPLATSLNKQRGKRSQMPSSLGHLRTFSERTHMSMKGFLRRMSKKTGNANVWSDARARYAQSSAGFNHLIN